jgi:histidinol-phosphatase
LPYGDGMNAHPPDTTQRLELAIEAARQAGRITLEYFRRDDLQVQRKADDSPVTAADRRAEEHLRRRIAEAFPEDAVLGEELPDRPGSSGFRWILDPIDGTKSFIHGVPLYGTLVGVERQGTPVLGLILIPALGECVYAATGRGAWYVAGDGPPRPARVSVCSSLAEGLFLTSEVANFSRIGRRDVYHRLEDTARLSRSWGDCYGYLLVATGRAELMVDPVAAVWDLAALLPVIEEAGGTFSDWQGRRTIHSGQCVASNGRIHDQVLALISKGGKGPATQDK